MKRNQITLLLFFLLTTFSSYAQKKSYYLDENMHEVNHVLYLEKCSSRILKCLVFTTDSLIIHKVVFRYKFGNIDSLGYKQIKSQLVQNKKNKLNKNTVLLINYRDSLYDSKARERGYERHIKKHKNVHHKPFSVKNFHKRRRTWIKLQKKCIKKFNKLNAATFYVYNYDYGSIKEYPELGWTKDRSVFKNVFFKIIRNNNFLIIKPNGEFFLSGDYHLYNDLIKKLIQEKDWSSFKKDWQKSYQSLHNTGYGLFKRRKNHEKHCF